MAVTAYIPADFRNFWGKVSAALLLALPALQGCTSDAGGRAGRQFGEFYGPFRSNIKSACSRYETLAWRTTFRAGKPGYRGPQIFREPQFIRQIPGHTRIETGEVQVSSEAAVHGVPEVSSPVSSTIANTDCYATIGWSDDGPVIERRSPVFPESSFFAYVPGQHCNMFVGLGQSGPAFADFGRNNRVRIDSFEFETASGEPCARISFSIPRIRDGTVGFAAWFSARDGLIQKIETYEADNPGVFFTRWLFEYRENSPLRVPSSVLELGRNAADETPTPRFLLEFSEFRGATALTPADCRLSAFGLSDPGEAPARRRYWLLPALAFLALFTGWVWSRTNKSVIR